MNDSTEQMMKGWRPRQPSPGLRNRIFASDAASTPTTAALRVFDLASLMHWLVPALGCFVLVTGTLNHPDFHTSLSARESNLASAVVYGVNKVPATTLEWTFGQPSISSNDSFLRTETNTL